MPKASFWLKQKPPCFHSRIRTGQVRINTKIDPVNSIVRYEAQPSRLTRNLSFHHTPLSRAPEHLRTLSAKARRPRMAAWPAGKIESTPRGASLSDPKKRDAGRCQYLSFARKAQREKLPGGVTLVSTPSTFKQRSHAVRVQANGVSWSKMSKIVHTCAMYQCQGPVSWLFTGNQH